MSRLMDSVLDDERRADCAAGDEADRQADEERRIALERRLAQYRAPYWPFAELEPRQARNSHPANHERATSIFRRPEAQ